ncbi:MAG: YajQ family cyclic di-GMP-binding protein [Pseudomonadota bacterium]
MPSFDIVSKIDMQEIDNAVNSVLRELKNRYDFKGAIFEIVVDAKESKINIHAEDQYKLGQIGDSLKVFATKRGIDVKSLEFEEVQKAGGQSLRQAVKIKQGIDSENAKKVTKYIKDKKLKVQASIRGEEVRVEGKKRDDLQDVMNELKSFSLDLPLQFINFRD